MYKTIDFAANVLALLFIACMVCGLFVYLQPTLLKLL